MNKRTRFCVFCGDAPKDKNNEHVIPQWLIGLTGDPKRVVTICFDYSKDRKPIRFDWSSLAMPACSKCNGAFAKLEGVVKPIVTGLLDRQHLPASDYILLLNWLDKVRVGAWLNFKLLEKHPLGIEPNFHIKQRVAQKDRMLALYTLDGGGQGLNVVGCDSMIFRVMPSCFALRINDVLLVNASADFFCSESCGFPFPSRVELIKGGVNDGALQLSDFMITRRIANPISEFPWIKPTVLIHQPVMTPSDDLHWQGGFLGDYNAFDSFLHQHRLPDGSGQGILFRQWADRVEPIYDLGTSIELDEVGGDDSKTLNEIIAQVYDFQVHLYDGMTSKTIGGKLEDSDNTEWRRSIEAMKIETTRELAEFYRNAIPRSEASHEAKS